MPFRAEYGMPFYIATSWQSFISAHILSNHSITDAHVLSDVFIPAGTVLCISHESFHSIRMSSLYIGD